MKKFLHHFWIFCLPIPLLLRAQTISWQRSMMESSADFFQIKNQAEDYFNTQDGAGQEEGGEWSQYSRWEYFWSSRISEKGNPSNQFQGAYVAMKDFASNRDTYCSSSNEFQGNWELVGPRSMPEQQMGMITSLWIDPLNEHHILAGSSSGGLWKSSYNSQTETYTWNCITDGLDGLPAMGIQEIAVDPSNTQNIWIASGLFDQGRGGYGIGLAKSTDGGATWLLCQPFLDKLTTLSIPTPYAYTVKYKPGSSQVLFATVKNHILRSEDGGLTWTSFSWTANPMMEFADLDFLPGSPDVIFVSGSDKGGAGGGAAVFRTVDGGNTWSQISGIFDFASEFLLNGTFDTGSLFPWLVAGTGSGNNQWHVVNDGGDYKAELTPLVNDEQYLFQTENFNPGSVKKLSLDFTLPAYSSLSLRLTTDANPDPANQNANDYTVTIYSNNSASSVSFTNFTVYVSYPATSNSYYQRIVFSGKALAGYNSGVIRMDNCHLNPQSVEVVRVSCPTADEVYYLYNVVFDRSYIARASSNGSVIEQTIEPTVIDAYYFRCEFEVSPSNTEIIYQGNLYSYKSISRGETFTTYSIPHVDVRELKLYYTAGTAEGGTDVIFLGTDGGVAKSTDGGVTYQDLNGTGLAITQFYGFANTEWDKDLITGGSQDNGTFQSLPVWTHVYGGDGFNTEYDKLGADFSLLQSSGGSPPSGLIRKSFFLSDTHIINPFNTFLSNLPQLASKPMYVHPKSGRLYVGYNDLYSNENTTTYDWRTIGNNSTHWIEEDAEDEDNLDDDQLANYPIVGFDVNPYDEIRKYIAYNGPANNCRLVKWDVSQSKYIEVSLGLPTIWFQITDVVTRPTNADSVWVTFGNFDVDWSDPGNPVVNAGQNRVYFSHNGGLNWFDKSAGLPAFSVNTIVYQEGSDDILYVGTDVGVYVWNKVLNQWECFSENFPAAIVSELEINYCAGKLRAATFGRGIWESDLRNDPMKRGITLSSNETWNTDQRLTINYIVPTGETLTIQNCTISMPRNGFIKIQPGGALILDGCTLTNNCGYMWSGIQVLGDPTKKQSPATNQGVLIMKNGAMIENAYVAAMADEAYYSTPDYTFPNGKSNGDGVDEHGGGIIQVLFNETDPVTISNCRKGIGFAPYHSPLVNGVEPANKSYLYGCVFENTRLLNPPDDNMYAMDFISMWNVHGVGISGCRFYGPTGVNQSVSQVKAITSADADYTVGDFCISQNLPCSNVQHTEFHDLYRGVYSVVADPAAAARLLQVSNSTFDNVRRSVYLSGHQNADVIFNTINLNQTSNDTSYGIYTNGCTFYTIEENTINGAVQIRPLSYGIIINNSVSADNVNDDNLVYKNYLENLQYGTVSMRRNANTTTGPESGFHGLEFRCNEYRNVKYSIAAFPIPNSNQKATLKFAQGSSSDPAGNYFELYSGQYSIYKQQIPDPIYYYHDLPNYDPTDYLYAHFSPSATAITTVSCPSHFSGGGGQQRLEAYSPAEAKLEIQSCLYAADSLLGFIDGGNTAELLSLAGDVNLPSSDLKVQLIGAGPYLSDTVLNTTLARSNPMKNSDTKEVILNNSPVTDTVYSVLEEEKPLVAENAVVINAQEGVSERSNLLAEVGDLYLQTHLALHDLRDYYEEIDSVNEFYQYLVDEHRNEYAIPYAFQFNELETAETMIESMSESDLKAFYQLAYDKQAAGTSIYSLQPDELDWMHSIANEESVSGLMALNLLSIVESTAYYEDIPVIDEDGFQAERLYDATLIPSTEWMLPSPNPANTDIMILFAPEFSSDGSELIMSDLSGRTVWSCIIPDDFATVTIPVDQLSSGVYFLQLRSDDQLLETQKLVVSR